LNVCIDAGLAPENDFASAHERNLTSASALALNADPVGADDQREAAISVCLIHRNRSLPLVVSSYKGRYSLIHRLFQPRFVASEQDRLPTPRAA
jgi:hypothetical protein